MKETTKEAIEELFCFWLGVLTSGGAIVVAAYALHERFLAGYTLLQ